jgi:hypothetical protein
MQSTEQLAALITQKHEVLVQLQAVAFVKPGWLRVARCGIAQATAAKQHLITRLQELERN